MTQTSLTKILEAQVQESDTSSFDVGEQRQRNMRYYSMQPLGNEQKGRSHYISPDVLDAVESKKAIFSESFLTSRQAVKFANCPYPGEAAAKTVYVNEVFKRNNHTKLFRDGWHDAFVEKRMVILGEWYKDTVEETVEVQQMPAPMVMQNLQQMGEELVGYDDTNLQQVGEVQSQQGPIPTVSGPLTLEKDDSYIRLSLVPQDRFFRDPEATYIEDAMWCTVSEDTPRGTLVAQGYDPEQIKDLRSDYTFGRDDAESARKAHDSSWGSRGQRKRAKSQEQVTWYRTFTWLDPEDFDDAGMEGFEPEEGFTLYEIHWASGEVLQWAPEAAQEGAEPQPTRYAIKVAEEHAFFEWTEMKIPHAENGICTADVVSHTQKTQSGLKRLVYDNQQMRNSSRTLALTGALKNPRDLLDNKIGATIWTKKMDAVMPLPSPELSPMTMDVISMFKADGEERSGMSSLGKGMNSDAVKYQNADDMIARLTNAGTRRVTAAARDFANLLLIPLSQFVVRIGKANDKGTSTKEYAGQQIEITPAKWQDTGYEMDVAVALTPDEGALLSNKLLTMHGVISADEEMKLNYGVPQKHALFDMVYDTMGISDTANILLSPNSPEYREAKQKAEQQGEMARQKAEQVEGVQLDSVLAQTEVLRDTSKLQNMKFSWDQTNDMHSNTLDLTKQSWQEKTDTWEFELEKQQKRNVSI